MSFIPKLFLTFILLPFVAYTATGQSCSGSWAANVPLSYDCVSGQWIGSTNPGTEPVGCPVNPTFIAEQMNTFNFTTPVSSFSIDFNAFSTGPGCARMEIKINGIFYPLTASNLTDLPAASGCSGLFSAMALSPDGYITSNATSMLQTNGQGRIIITGVNANSITLSTNDGAGSVFTDPFNCMEVVPIKMESFTGASGDNCKAILSWQTGMESNIRNIELQRSADGIIFSKAGEVPAKGSNSRYMLSTNNFADGYFRLKINDLDGQYEYSEVLKVKANCSSAGYQVYPNPAHRSIAIQGLKKDDQVLIFDMLGRLVKAFDEPHNNNSFDIHALVPGVYNLQVVNHDNSVANLKVVKN